MSRCISPTFSVPALPQASAQALVPRLGQFLMAFVLGLLMLWTTVAQAGVNFVNAASMATARSYHSGTVLASGKVLVAGGLPTDGYSGGSLLNGSELYDPATNTWSATGNLNARRWQHRAVRLADGRVLIAGGITSTGLVTAGVASASAEIYDPATGLWSSTGSMATARAGHTMTLLGSGLVLVTGGGQPGTVYGADSGGSLWSNPSFPPIPVAGAELYNPATGVWSSAAAMSRVRADHTATLLNSGRVLVVGGEGSVAPSTAEIYDPGSNTWASTAGSSISRNAHVAALLTNGKVLIAGSLFVTPNTPELYDPAAGTWATTGQRINTGQALHSALIMPDGQVLGSETTWVELYNPGTGTWGAGGTPTNPRDSGSSANLLGNGKVLVAGGSLGGGTTNTAELFTEAAPLAASSVVLSTTPNPSTLGASVLITATVTGSTPTGTVSFTEGSTTLCGAVAVSAGVATCSLPLAYRTVGTHNYVGTYSGNASNSPSTSAPATQYINASSTVLTSSANPSTLGQAITLTATISGTAPITGTVTFMEGATTLGTATVSGGSASFSTSALTVGSHGLTAAYGGDANNGASTSPPISQLVNASSPAASSTALTSSVNPSTVGQAITLTATVTGSTPTGSVTFKDGATTLGTATVSGGSASLSTSALALGSHTLTAVYGGDAGNASSTSSPLTQVVNAAAPVASSTVLTSSVNPSTLGQAITLTATVTGSTPTGSVTFKDGATTLGTATVSGGSASLSTSALALGSHTLTAVYGGDAGNASSTSSPLTQVVNAAAPVASSTVLTSSVNPSTVGQAITLTATVTGSTPTGSVTFKDGATTLGTATISGGSASLSTSALAAGSHSLTAVYGGDAGNASSTSSPLTQVVNPAASSTALTSSANPGTVGQTITLTATVSGSTPTGSVTFKDGATILGSATISGGTASLSIAALGAGSHSLTAVYGGNASNGASTSSALSLTMNSAAANQPTVAPIPTLSEWALLALSVLMFGAAVSTMRRRPI